MTHKATVTDLDAAREQRRTASGQFGHGRTAASDAVSQDRASALDDPQDEDDGMSAEDLRWLHAEQLADELGADKYEVESLFHNKGVTVGELREAVGEGVEVFPYELCRRMKATHVETMQAHRNGIDLTDYGMARNCVDDHTELMSAHGHGVQDLPNYAKSLGAGATSEECGELIESGFDNWGGYATGRNLGVSHDDLSQAATFGVQDLATLSRRMRNGASLVEAMTTPKG